MAPHRVLLLVSLWGLAGALALGSLATVTHPAELAQSHRAVSLAGFVLPALTFLHLHALDRILGRRANRIKANFRAFAFAFAAILAAGAPLADPTIRPAALAVSGLVLVAAGGATTGLLLRLIPDKRSSVVDVGRDPLTKGDDACLAHMRFAHYFLPLGLLAIWLGGAWWPWSDALAGTLGGRLLKAGDHWLLAGYALLSLYGLSHLWVPRLSNVPAIAAGAIKGELHSSLLGLVLLPLGFLLDERWLRITGGLSLFIGCFTFMGVLGANIMRNKSPTQRVTPEFNYVPWTFAGAFWLIAGVLLGVFLNAIGPGMERLAPALRSVHVHLLLLGGFAIMLLGYAHRVLPMWLGVQPPTFQRTKWGFYLLNLAVALFVIGRIGSEPGYPTATYRAAGVVAVFGLAAWFFSLQPYLRRSV